MYGQLHCKNSDKYCISNKNYREDYACIKSNKIDMTLSGTYLSKYPFRYIKKYKLDKYPSAEENFKLITSIKNKYKFYDEKYSIILGAGSNGLIQNICKILLKDGGNMIMPYLSFEQAEYATNSFNAETRKVFLKDYQINLKFIEESIDKKTKLVYICNPNNPTGLLLENREIKKLVRKYPNIYFMIDESNIEFSEQESLLETGMCKNMIVLKSFSKAYGLSNLRIGYLVCECELEELYKDNVTINEFSGISTYYANKVINSNNYKNNVKKIKKEINYLKSELNSVKIKTLNTFSNTLFTETIFKDEFIKVLDQHNISLVPVWDQNNKLHFRIACQKHKINKLFINELKRIEIEKYIILL